jgi:hypothetical protein
MKSTCSCRCQYQELGFWGLRASPGFTYTGVVTENVKSLLVDLAGETLEAALEDVLGLLAQQLDALLNGGEGGDVLVLDNVLALNQGVDIARNVKRSGSIAPGRGSEDSREDGEKGSELHDEGKDVYVVVMMYECKWIYVTISVVKKEAALKSEDLGGADPEEI